MSSSSSNKKKKSLKHEPELDPYDVLGLEPDAATDTVINKAYRKWALKLHPDKQQNLTAAQAEEVAKQFHGIKEARAFLLDPEFQEARLKYDAQRASLQQRRKEDARRDQSMSARRKRMQKELERQEYEATKNKRKKNRRNSSDDEEFIKTLRREGSNRRTALATRQVEEEARRQTQKKRHDRKKRERLLQDRQVRLKWSRKKMTISPSEHSLAMLLSSKFGCVEEVEMIGSKGNLAIITFAEPSSCRPCVEAYKDRDEMRAFFVGKRTEEEGAKSAAQQQEHEAIQQGTRHGSRDNESLYDRQQRQEAKRKRLLREMGAEEEESTTKTSNFASATVSSRSVAANFPSTEVYRHLTAILKLEKAEEDILGSVLSGKH